MRRTCLTSGSENSPCEDEEKSEDESGVGGLHSLTTRYANAVPKSLFGVRN
jgi:hypothetical protein